MAYDFTDPLVVTLVSSTHTPSEIPPATNDPDSTRPIELSLVCSRCYNAWPCPIVQQYREYVATTQAKSPAPGQVVNKDANRAVDRGLARA